MQIRKEDQQQLRLCRKRKHQNTETDDILDKQNQKVEIRTCTMNSNRKVIIVNNREIAKPTKTLNRSNVHITRRTEVQNQKPSIEVC